MKLFVIGIALGAAWYVIGKKLAFGKPEPVILDLFRGLLHEDATE